MLIPHLHFCCDYSEAIGLYEKAFGTKADTILHNDDGSILHAEMHIHGQRVMLNNRFGNRNKSTDCAVAMIVIFKGTDELLACYEIMKQGSVTIDPLEKASYTELGVQFLDKFGVQWGFMVDNQGEEIK